MTRRMIVAALLAATAAAPAAASSSIDSYQSYSALGNAPLISSTGFDFKPLDFSKSAKVGGITGSVFTGYYGAKVTASIGAKLEFSGGLQFSNQVGELATGSVHTFAGNPFGALTPGSAFVLGTQTGPNKLTSSIGKGQVDAVLDATVYAGAGLYGKGCIVLCVSGTLASIGVGQPDPLHVLAYHSATNSVTFLDKDYNNVLPKDFSSDTLPITATLQAIDVSGTAKGTNATQFHTSQQIAGAYVDVAKAIVDLFGLPGDVLSGSVLGFDYTTVAAKIGAGINAVYDVTSQVVDQFTRYDFSSKVQMLNPVTNQWGKPIDHVILDSGDAVVLRPISDIASLSILPKTAITTQVDATAKLNASLEFHTKILEVSGYGLDAGPLYHLDTSVSLGTIAKFGAHSQSTSLTALAPLTLDFNQSNGFAAASFVASLDGDDATRIGGTSAFVFVPDPSAAPTDTVAGTIRLALNYNSDGCNARLIDRCVYDETFTPVAEQQRTTRDATGAPVVTFAVDFDSIDRLTALPDGAFGEQSTDASLAALVARLAGIGGYTYDTGRSITNNTTPFMAGVPEPATWGTMIVGFGLVGAMARRRRGAVAVTA